jgi:protoheme ferro-lyase
MTTKRKKYKTGIIMIGHGEPEVFEEELWAEALHEMFEELKRTGIEAPPDEAIPLMLPIIEGKYAAIGGRSRHNEIIGKQSELIARTLHEHVVSYGFNEFTSPHFTDVTGQMIREGITRMVFVPMLMTDSSHTQEIKNKIECMNLQEQGVAWVMSKPLFYRPEPVQLVINKIMRAAGNTPPDKTGILLVSHGEPDQWALSSTINTKCNEQEKAFALSVKKGLIEKGFPGENIVRAFNEFTHPEIAEAAEGLAHNKIKKIIAAATFGNTDCIHVNYDIPAKVKESIDNAAVEIVCIDGWNEDPLLITAYCELIKESLLLLAENQIEG